MSFRRHPTPAKTTTRRLSTICSRPLFQVDLERSDSHAADEGPVWAMVSATTPHSTLDRTVRSTFESTTINYQHYSPFVLDQLSFSEMAENALIPAYLSLGLQALGPIVLGSFKSLKVRIPSPHSFPVRTVTDPQTPATTLARRKKAADVANRILTEDEEEEADDSEDEVLSWADSLWFPIFGSIALVGLWALLKYVGKEWINFCLGIYCE